MNRVFKDWRLSHSFSRLAQFSLFGVRFHFKEFRKYVVIRSSWLDRTCRHETTRKSAGIRAHVAHIYTYTWVEIKRNYSRCTIQPGRGIAYSSKNPTIVPQAISMPGPILLLIGGVNTLKCSEQQHLAGYPANVRVGEALYIRKCVTEWCTHNRRSYVPEYLISVITTWPWMNSDVHHGTQLNRCY